MTPKLLHPSTSSSHPSPSSLNISSHSLSYDETINPYNSNGICVDDNKIKKIIDNHKYSLFSTNIRSLNRNINQLRCIVNEFQPDFVTISEIFRPQKDFVKLQDYHLIMKTREGKNRGGGVALYAKKIFDLVPIENINGLKLDKVEAIAAKLKMNDSSISIIAVYRPPECTINETINDLNKIFMQLDSENCIIAGDMNINCLVENNFKETYLDLIFKNNFYRKINPSKRSYNFI